MRLPRDLSADELVHALARAGYQVTRQKGSHVRLTTNIGGEHHVTIPAHGPLRVGTLSGILNDVAGHFKISREDLLRQLFGEQ